MGLHPPTSESMQQTLSLAQMATRGKQVPGQSTGQVISLGEKKWMEKGSLEDPSSMTMYLKKGRKCINILKAKILINLSVFSTPTYNKLCFHDPSKIQVPRFDFLIVKNGLSTLLAFLSHWEALSALCGF